MQFPRIHLNGTNGKTLQAGYETALIAVRKAIEAVQNITVHGRDYYVINAEASNTAYREHQERLAKLSSVREELEAIWENINDQIE